MTTPSQVFDYDMETQERVLAQDAGSPERPRSEPIRHPPCVSRPRRTARRCRSPCSTAKTPTLDGTAPLLLYGYGSYGMTIPAGFMTNALSLVDRGFVYAIAHIRGGKDKGFAWYKNGKRAKKVNTLHGLHRRGRVSRGRKVHVARAASSPKAAARAAC